MENEQLVTLTAEIVSAHVGSNQVDAGQVGYLIQRVHEALAGLGQREEEPVAKVPVVSVRASIRPDRIICMECGRETKMLKKHLQVAHGMTPDDYRQDYGLPSNYPMIAPEYAQRRRDIAKETGLGRKKGEKPGSRKRGSRSKEAKSTDTKPANEGGEVSTEG